MTAAFVALVLAKSSFPSLFRSEAVKEFGFAPTCKKELFWNVPLPFPSITAISALLESLVAMSKYIREML